MKQPVCYDPDTGEEIVVAQFATAYVPFSLASFSGYEVVVTLVLSTALATAGEGGVAVPAVPSAGASSTGVVVGGLGNRCEVYALSTNRKIADSSGNEVYARVTHDGTDFRLSFVSLVDGAETQHTFAAGSAIAVEVPYRFHRYVLPHDWFTRYNARRPYQDVQGGGSLSLLDLVDADFPPGGYTGLAGAVLRVNGTATGFEAVPEGDPAPTVGDVDIGSVDGSVVVVKGGTANHPEFDVSVPGGPVHCDSGPQWYPRLYDVEEAYELRILHNFCQFRKVGPVVYVVFSVNFRIPAGESPSVHFTGFPYYSVASSRLGSFLLMSPGNAASMTVSHLMAAISGGFGDVGWFQASSGNGDYYRIPSSVGDADWWIQGEFFYFASNDDRINFLYDGNDGAGNNLDGGVFGDSYTRTVDCGQSFV